MAVIHKLPDRVVNQIAAGEVVERPVAVVRELVENALDAGARRIEVEFHQGGKALIRVTDDGCGMTPEDARLALERHATSKIRSIEDVLRIGSFGFRGEALPSIASVARFTLRTRPADQPEGTEIQVDSGRLRAQRACGMPPGTMIEVAQLFIAVPARRKFLKTDRTEAAHIIHFCRLVAVAHPGVAFTLVEDGQALWQSAPCASTADRVREICGRQHSVDLMPLAHAEGTWRLDGLIARPGVGRVTRADMVTYVNRRPVDSRVLQYALLESYHTYIPKGRYPPAFLFLELPPEQVDVNVHPAKREVRFRNEGEVRRFVMEGLLATLRAVRAPALEAARAVDPVLPPGPVPPGAPGAAAPAATPVTIASPPPAGPASGAVPQATAGPPPRGDFRHLGVLRGAFQLFESSAGLLLLHPRAARERIHFEDIRRALAAVAASSQGLLFPAALELDPLDARALQENLAAFTGMGFAIEPFGRLVYRLRAVPAWFDPEQGEAFLRDLVQLARERGWRPDGSDRARTELARLAARRLARAEHRGEDPAALLRRLLACTDPLTDPAGRPTFIELRTTDLERRFGL
jgi:DNA mismatch repair protein MutL